LNVEKGSRTHDEFAGHTSRNDGDLDLRGSPRQAHQVVGVVRPSLSLVADRQRRALEVEVPQRTDDLLES
jgi:hypothetical protein